MRPVTLRARGHANVRALHPKTIELTADRDLTERGTCIVGVAATLDPGALSGLTGAVTVTFTAGAVSDAVHGLANPAFRPEHGRAVIRCSRHRSPDTLVYAADRGAADLDRGLVAALARGAELRVTIAPDVEASADHLVLVPQLPLDEETARRIRAADEVALATPVPSLVAAAILAGVAGPVTIAGQLPRRRAERDRALQGATAAVWEVRPEDAADVARQVGERLVALVLDPATPNERVLRSAPATPVRATRAVVAIAAHAAPTGDIDSLVSALLEAGVAPRTLQEALAAATGLSRKQAYDRVLRLKR